MYYKKLVTCMVVCGLIFVGATTASAVIVPVTLAMDTPGGGYNQPSFTIDVPGVDSDTDSTDVTGWIYANLYTDFHPVSHVATVTGIGFTHDSDPTKNLSFSNMHFALSFLILSETVDSYSMKGYLDTESPPKPVNSGSLVPTAGHDVWLNSGTFVAAGDFGDYTFDLTDEAVSAPAEGPNGTLTVTGPTVVGGQYKYDVTLVMPVDFSEELETDYHLTVSGTGSLRATGSFYVVPEPGTIVILLGLAATLAGYCWWKRRGGP